MSATSFEAGGHPAPTSADHAQPMTVIGSKSGIFSSATARSSQKCGGYHLT